MIWLSDEWKDYEVLDTSDGERLERWGKYILVRPDPQVIWSTPKTHPAWNKFDARYIRSNTGGGHWSDHKLPERWQIRYKDYLTFNVKPMNFKHTGVFPEQAANWDFIREKCANVGRPVRVLNMFAYSGGATLAAAISHMGMVRSLSKLGFLLLFAGGYLLLDTITISFVSSATGTFSFTGFAGTVTTGCTATAGCAGFFDSTWSVYLANAYR